MRKCERMRKTKREREKSICPRGRSEIVGKGEHERETGDIGQEMYNCDGMDIGHCVNWKSLTIL